ncbi:MAG TPA: hypothetical protein EYQ85_05530 [Candidatus Poseidoniales archaeon]|nr:hypothetical protein [Candidatus Poseidoniales archaeon]
MPKVLIDLDHRPVSIRHPNQSVLDSCLFYLRNQHHVRKRSISMPDRHQGGFIAFIYQAFDPRWIITWDEKRLSLKEEE